LVFSYGEKSVVEKFFEESGESGEEDAGTLGGLPGFKRRII
jgi:hypothetical protein